MMTLTAQMKFHENETMKLLVEPVVFCGLSLAYVIGVWILVNIMMTKKPVYVKPLMQVYNVVQIVVCSYMVWGLLPCIGFPNIFGINSDLDQRGEWFVYVHYLSKYLDWFDTLFILLNKKRSQLSFLHVYHHGTIGAVWALLLHQGVGSGSVRYGAWINSLTHVIMYSHYLWTSFGFKNPFKKMVTFWQIGQFYSCLVHAFAVIFLDSTPCQKYAWIQVVYQITMVYLFSNMLSWVPKWVPDFSAKKDEGTISVFTFLGQVASSMVKFQKTE